VDPPGGIPCLTVLPRVLQGPQRAPPVGGLAFGVLPRRARRRPRVPGFAGVRSGPTDQAPTDGPGERARGPRAQAVCGGPSCAMRRACRPPRRV